ncbi:Acg family FMN-binding oxidoreductase [Paractinoplanes brasiliensis]|uniref:Nitroreductase family protein n=1 Tax=Paractinoplanes brasiliensis TaxID=52695 RepID=A0A4V6PSV3_9ACTN|nr:nitroreductase family protein [Actinoplanes brasiliensis]TDO38428.1 nitroreductase family protein [Actinoplanes brasiliensis]GID26799.1 NAD(P)H nitroreductase [Actinoplanes brasiliensis]
MVDDTDTRPALILAAEAARFAPSIHNTQPWRWTVHSDRMELRPMAGRQLQVQDPEGKMLLLSCGAALHHARVALDADGWRYDVDLVAADPLAVLRLRERGVADPAAIRSFEQLPARHTDRRTVSDEPVPAAVLDALTAAAEQAGARLHLLTRDQVIELAVLVERAQKTESADEQLRAETAAWVGGDRADGAGIPDASIPAQAPLTTVAERDFGTTGTLVPGPGHDNAASYAVLYGTGDEAVDWLRAGVALSAMWLLATEHGVTLVPISSPVEVPFTRRQLERTIGAIGIPHFVMRLGVPDPANGGPARTPRLPSDQVIELRD